MKKTHHPGINDFLNASGLFQSDNEDDIKKAKKAYWAAYKKNWNKRKRLQCKSYEILFNQHELKIILSRAQKTHSSPTAFIKSMALGKHPTVSPIAIGELREKMVLCQNQLLDCICTKQISQEAGNCLLSQMMAIQENVLSLLAP